MADPDHQGENAFSPCLIIAHQGAIGNPGRSGYALAFVAKIGQKRPLSMAIILLARLHEHSGQGGIMKKRTARFVLLAFILSIYGCSFQRHVAPAGPPMPMDFDRGMAKPVMLVGILTLGLVAAGAVFKIVEQQKEQRLFARIGRHVPYVMHEEAPVGARLLGEVECREYSQIEVKNNLRTQAAQMGGNLLVIDTISESRFPDNVLTFSGSGRVYLVKRDSTEVR